ncbi:MAG: STAS domain-containing protein [Eubacterium sp.]|nr:STAS domain-containing protein [Eubacterium sp.]
MTINKTSNGSALTLAVEGRLETTTAPELEAVVKNELDGVTELTFDFSNLDYISSAGLRVLLVAQKKMNVQGSMKVTNANEIVNEIFSVTGFTDILTIE